MVAKSSPNTRWLLAMTGQPRPHRNDGNVPFVDGEPRTKRNGIHLQSHLAETFDRGLRVHVRIWRLSRGRALCHSERSRGMEWLGKPRHRRAGRRPSEREAIESISNYSHLSPHFRFGSRVVCSSALTGDSDNARVFGNVTPASLRCNDIGRATAFGPALT